MMKRLLAAALFAAISLPAAASSGDAEAGQRKSTTCAACHGANGISASPDFPNLAGQFPDYIETALTHYKNGKRKNPIMQAQVANLTPKDIQDLAAYFSHQGGLKVKH